MQPKLILFIQKASIYYNIASKVFDIKNTIMKKKHFAIALILAAFVSVTSGCYVGYGYGHPHYHHYYNGY